MVQQDEPFLSSATAVATIVVPPGATVVVPLEAAALFPFDDSFAAD